MDTHDPNPSPPVETRHGALGQTAARGAAWTFLQSAVQKGCGYLALIPLGYWLEKDEWGIYATAMAFAGFVMLMRDGGVRELLVQRGQREYQNLVGPVFWLAVTFNIATAAVMAAVAPLAATFYGDPRITALVLIPALTLVVGTPALVLRARLRIDLRFGLFARLSMFSALVHWGGAVALAYAGYGAKSLVLSLFVVAVFEWVVLEIMTRERLWRRRPEFGRWIGLLGQTKWLIFGGFAALTLNMGPFLVLGKLVEQAVLGVYFFGYQLVAQIAVLLSANLQTVFLPMFARLNDEPERQRDAVLRSLRTLVLLGSALSLGMATVIGPLEELLWRGKYADAVAATQLLALVFPVRVTYGLVTSALKARGAFRAWALITLAQGLGVMGAATGAGLLGYGATGIAACIGSYLGISGTVVLLVAMRWQGIRVRSTMLALLPAWVISVGVAGVCLAADRWLLGGQYAAVRVVLLGSAFAVGYTVLARVLLPNRCLETIHVMPAAVGRPVARLLGLSGGLGQE